MIGAVLVYLTYYLHWSETDDPGLKLAVFATGPAIRNYGWNLVTEIIGTVVLVFGVLTITGPWNVFTSDLAPLLIGLLGLVGLIVRLGPRARAADRRRNRGDPVRHRLRQRSPLGRR